MQANMPSKSLGALPLIYALDKQQHPLPHQTMLFEYN